MRHANAPAISAAHAVTLATAPASRLAARKRSQMAQERARHDMALHKADLDEMDWRILRILQEDGRITNVELAARIGMSAPPCLRRVKRLEEAGIIRGYRALLNAPALGQSLTAFCLVGLTRQSDADLRAFSALCQIWSMVREAWTIQGEADFMLRCVASDLVTFQDFVIDTLTKAPGVDTVRTALTIRQVKEEGMVSLDA
jgi:DNA-binding Lrp family transcriptional regulator